MFERNLFEGRVVLVTGGGTGLGKSMASRLAELGAKLVLVSRNAENLESAKTEIQGRAGAEVHVETADVREPGEVERAVKGAIARFGRIDALVNNAAGNFLSKTEDLSVNAWNAVVGIVLSGTFHATLHVGRHMIEKGGGNILNILTPYAWTGSAYVVPSAAAKAGVLAMTRSLAVEWARYRIRVNAIAPGPFPTPGAWERLMPDPSLEEMARQKVPAKRFGEHRELANLAAFLLSDGAPYITGEVVTIDGGEWLMGGGFNSFTMMPPENIDAFFATLKAARTGDRATPK